MNCPWEEGASPSVLLPEPTSLITMNCRMLQRPSHAIPTGQESRYEADRICLLLQSAAQRLSPTCISVVSENHNISATHSDQ
jgi:hypothetical protein